MQNLIFSVIIFFVFNHAFALSPEERLNNPQQEKQAQQIFLQVKCLTCKGQVIENSDSDFAYSLRQFIRKEIKNGKNEAEIKTILTRNFGSHILISSQKKVYLILIIVPILIVTIHCWWKC
jgi:cytochrome c-type biogenesis protein CcmH/NrfF